jgi:hypothetical protein
MQQETNFYEPPASSPLESPWLSDQYLEADGDSEDGGNAAPSARTRADASLAHARRAPIRAASLIAVAASTMLAKRSAWCPAISVTTDPPLCISAAAARRADLQLPEKLGILVFRIRVVQMRSGQKLIRPGLGEGVARLRIPQVIRHGPSWGAGSWGAGRLAACHCGLQYPNLTAIKAGPFHHAAITERPQHVPKSTHLSGRRPP